jgi:Helix-turn-helix domain
MENQKRQIEAGIKTGDLGTDFWMDKQEVLERFHITGRTLQTWRTNGQIPYKKIGRKIYYWYSDLIAFMKTKTSGRQL